MIQKKRKKLTHCQLILNWLREKPLTTYQSRDLLDIASPAPRIFDLKAKGFKIQTYMVPVYKSGVKHFIAKYVLFSGGANG